jgi:hypothetical protein
VHLAQRLLVGLYQQPTDSRHRDGFCRFCRFCGGVPHGRAAGWGLFSRPRALQVVGAA